MQYTTNLSQCPYSSLLHTISNWSSVQRLYAKDNLLNPIHTGNMYTVFQKTSPFYFYNNFVMPKLDIDD